MTACKLTVTLKTTPSKRYLFIGGTNGEYKQIDLHSQTIFFKHYGPGLPDCIEDSYGMTLSHDNKYLFACYSMSVVQHEINDPFNKKSYNFDRYTQTVITTYDNKWAFVAFIDGSVSQICLDTQKIIKTYSLVHNYYIKTNAGTRDNKYLITASNDKRIRKLSIETGQHDTGFYTGPYQDQLWEIQLALDAKSLFVWSIEHKLNLISLEDGKIIKSFGKNNHLGTSSHQTMVAIADGRYVFTCSRLGGLVQETVVGSTRPQIFKSPRKKIISVCN
jgi:WD40 repeat protein